MLRQGVCAGEEVAGVLHDEVQDGSPQRFEAGEARASVSSRGLIRFIDGGFDVRVVHVYPLDEGSTPVRLSVRGGGSERASGH